MATQTNQITITAWLAIPRDQRPDTTFGGQKVLRIVGDFKQGRYMIVCERIKFRNYAPDTLLDMVTPAPKDDSTAHQTAARRIMGMFDDLTADQLNSFAEVMDWRVKENAGGNGSTAAPEPEPAAEPADDQPKFNKWGVEDGRVFGVPTWDSETMAEHFSAAWSIVNDLIKAAVFLPDSTDDLHACFTAVEIIAKGLNRGEWSEVA
ncbi:MAG: hypothetical protein KF726_22950 [Anaerolineae bacterium]|nr:hypothetical protein [Anaerolineae bacterium]